MEQAVKAGRSRSEEATITTFPGKRMDQKIWGAFFFFFFWANENEGEGN